MTTLLRHAALSLALALSAPIVQAAEAPASACPFSEPFGYAGTRLLRHPASGAYVFAATHAKVDADGAPNAYHPDDVGLSCTKGTGFKGLDCPANAGYPASSWWPTVLVADPAARSRPYRQPAPGEFAGYFVSQTALTDATKAATDTARYVDARNVPYLVFPRNFYRLKGTGKLGDVGYAIHVAGGQRSPFVIAEIGPADATLGEMSIALGKALGGADPNPRTGAGTPSGTMLFVVFPKSAAKPAWPLSDDAIDAKASRLLNDLGGQEALLACADKLQAH